MDSLITPFFETLEVVCNGTSLTQFLLPQDEVLRDAKKILAVEAYSLAQVTVSPISGSALVNNTVFLKSFLNLVTRGVNESVITQIPLSRIVAANMNGEPFRIDILNINPTKCFISVGSVASLATTEVWLLGFHYAK